MGLIFIGLVNYICNNKGNYTMTNETTTTNETQAPAAPVLLVDLPLFKVFQYDRAILTVGQGFSRKSGPGLAVNIIDEGRETINDGIVARISTGGMFYEAVSRVEVACERAGIDLKSEDSDWQKVQDMGDEEIRKMVAEFDAEDAINEINAFREHAPAVITP